MSVVDAEVLSAALVAAGVPKKSIVMMDDEYYLPPSSWITGPLSASMSKFLFDSGFKYVPERFDCNHFAASAKMIADWCWQDTKGAPDAALAVGMFAYVSEGHCICVSAEPGPDGKPIVGFYEPQPGVPDGEQVFTPICLIQKHLSAEDIASCVCCFFF